MAKSRSTSGVTFDKDLAHALISRAISQLGGAGAVVGKRQESWLYRMGLVGVMASYVARDEDVPRAVMTGITKGVPLSEKRWQDVLGE